jgi:repressor LexA
VTFGERIQYLRAQKHISRNELALALGIKYAALSKYEKDERQPDYDTLAQIANYFDVSTDYLLGQTDIPIARKKRLTPLLGTIRAGLPIIADENIEEYIEVPEDFKADFVLRVQGDSMVGAGILDGDLAVCKQTQAAFSGQIVVALHDTATGFSEATLKFFYQNGNAPPMLRAANPSYPDIDMREGYRIAGVMVALIRREAPSYQIYKEFLAIKDHDEWIQAIETALGKGITPKDIIYMVEMQARISEKMSGNRLLHNYWLTNSDYDYDFNLNMNEPKKPRSVEKTESNPTYPYKRKLRPIPKLDE